MAHGRQSMCRMGRENEMSETKHTPGPWGVMKSETGPWAVFGNNGNWLATTCKKQWPSEDNANARLIAAAPELLDALENIVKTLSDADEEGMIEHAEQMTSARAAIAKARGQA